MAMRNNYTVLSHEELLQMKNRAGLTDTCNSKDIQKMGTLTEKHNSISKVWNGPINGQTM